MVIEHDDFDRNLVNIQDCQFLVGHLEATISDKEHDFFIWIGNLECLQGSNQGHHAQQPFTWNGSAVARSLL